MPTSIFDKLPNLNYIKGEVARKTILYNMYERYYLGTQYQQEFIKRYYRLYANTREFYSLISRAVDIDIQLIPGDWAVTDNQAQVDELLALSDWEQNGNLLVYFGCVFGDFYIKCYDDDGQIKLQPLDPRGIWLDSDKVIITRNIVNPLTGKDEEHAEFITADRINIFLNGELKSTSRNPFRLVPVFYGQHKSIGKNMGLNSFHNVLDEINAINEMATFLQEQTLRALINQKVVTGAAATQLEFGPDKTLFLPEGAKVDTLTGDIDVSGTLQFVQDIKNEVKASLPEFAYDKVATGAINNPASATAIQLQLMELITKIKRSRIGYDSTMKQALDTLMIMSGKQPISFEFDKNRPVISFSGEFAGLITTGDAVQTNVD